MGREESGRWDELFAACDALLAQLDEHAAQLRRTLQELKVAALADDAASRLCAPETDECIPPGHVTHQLGRPFILQRDPEQRAFTEARLGRMTYNEIARASAHRFGEERAIKTTAISKWKARLDRIRREASVK